MTSFTKKHIPAGYANYIADILKERGHDAAPLFHTLGIGSSDEDDALSRMSLLQFKDLLTSSMALCKDDGLGIEIGLRIRPSNIGMLGYAIMTSETPRHAMLLAIRFQALFLRELHLVPHEESGYLSVELRKGYFLGPARMHFLEMVMIGALHIGQLMGIDLGAAEIWFEDAEPDYFQAYRKRIPFTVHYNKPATLMRTPASLLDQRIGMADSSASRHATLICERQLERMEADAGNIVAKVRAQLVMGGQGYPDLGEVSGKLNMSRRTLSRKLEEFSTSFRKLLEQSRERDSVRLLKNQEIEIGEIAAQLGYVNPANFTRAFQKWKGLSPSQWRIQCAQKTRAEKNLELLDMKTRDASGSPR